MSRLFEISRDYDEMFNLFDEIDDLEPDVNENGEPVDMNGNVIDDIDTWHEAVKTQWFNELVAKEDEFDIKAENVAQYIKNLDVEIAALADEKKRIDARKKVKENKLERMKEYLKNCMLQTGREKIETAKVKLSIRNNAESVSIYDEKAFTEYYKESDPRFFKFKVEIDKTAIKKLIQSGENIDGVTLERKKSLLIK